MIDKNFWDTPDSWELKRFEDIVDTTSGKAFDSGRFTESDSDGRVPVIRIRDIHSDTTEAYTDEDFKEKYTVRSGDLLVGMDGDFEASFWDGSKAALNLRDLKVDSTRNISQEFLKYWFDIVLAKIHTKVPKATVKHLSVNKHLNPSYIPVPPSDIQEKIVKEVQEQLATLDKLGMSVENIGDLSLEYKESLLTFLFAGKQDLSSKSPERISTEQDIPDHWELRNISEISVDMNTGSTPRRSDDENWGGNIKWAKAGEISSAEKYITDTEEKVTEEASANTYGQDYVFVTIIGSNLGSVVLPKDKMGINQQNVSIELSGKVNREYFYYYIQGISGHLQELGRGGGQQAINQTILGDVKIPIPPLDEQEEIIKKIETVDLNRVSRAVRDVDGLFTEYRDSVLAHALQQKSTQTNRETNEPLFAEKTAKAEGS